MKNRNEYLKDGIFLLIGGIGFLLAGIEFFTFKIDNWEIEIEPPRKMIMNMSQANFSYILQCGCFLVSFSMLVMGIGATSVYFSTIKKKEHLKGKTFESKLPRKTQLKIAENVEDLIISMQNEIDGLQKENNKLLEYHDFFRSYYNEDWDRNTPFIDQIEFSNRFLRYREILPLSTKIKDLNLTSEDKKELTLKFYYHEIEELPLAMFFMLMNDLKGFKEDITEENSQAPRAFFEHQLEFYTKKLS